MMKFDFILFENAYNIENHYKDLCVMARLLKNAGYNVAFLDAFKEDSLCKEPGIPHIKLPFKGPREFSCLRVYRSNNNPLQNLIMQIRQDLYMYRIIRFLRGRTKNIYMGSLMMSFPILFMFFLSKNTNYYLWGLRSATLLLWKKSKFTKAGISSKILHNRIKTSKCIRIVVSNQLIRKEFEDIVGIEKQRIILRPERIIQKGTEICNVRNDELILLTIGTLRPFKHVEFALDALRKLNDSRIHYIIAGRCKDDCGYEQMIHERMKGIPNVTRINRFIPDEEYEQLMNSCTHLLLCDGTQESCASNGTMLEALLHGKPIIAPNFNPFKYEVETYKVGHLYKYGDVDSLCEVLREELIDNIDKYSTHLSYYQSLYLEDAVSENLKKQIEEIV